MNQLIEAAKFWLDLGVATIPIRWRSKQPSVSGGWNRFMSALPSDEDFARWYPTEMNNIAVICGWNNLCVLDFDDMSVFEDWKKWCEVFGGYALRVLEYTLIVKSARGIHVYVFLDQIGVNMKLAGIDVLAQRKYVLFPPSIHPSGVAYSILQDKPIMHVRQLSMILPAAMLVSGRQEHFAQVVIPHAHPTEQVDFSDLFSEAVAEEAPSVGLIASIKERVRIESFFPQAIRTGDHWMMTRCPFHDDHNPSFWIDTAQQICGCQAGCTSMPLDVINLFARLNGISNFEAIRELAKGL